MGTHHRGTRQEIRALDAYIALMRAADSVTARTSPVMGAHGLTVSQFGALEALWHLGPLCQKDLGAKILKTSGNVTVVVDNLERRGLVERHRDGDDRRVVTVHLTAAGRRLVARAFPDVLAAIVANLGVLSPAQQESLHELCRTLGKGRNRVQH